MSFSGTCPHRPVPCSSICKRALEVAEQPLMPILFINESRFTLSTSDRCEPLQRWWGYAVCNIICEGNGAPCCRPASLMASLSLVCVYFKYKINQAPWKIMIATTRSLALTAWSYTCTWAACVKSFCGVLVVLLLISFAQRSRYWPCCWLVAFLWPRPATNNHSQCWRSVIFKFYCYDTTIS